MTGIHPTLAHALAPLFERAEKGGLWFYSRYQDLWFSPDELRKEQAAGNFRWGPVNWTLRDPAERLAILQSRYEEAKNAYQELAARLGVTAV